MAQRGMVIHQGEVYWVLFSGEGSEPWGRRPALVLQHDRFNRSRLNTVVVVAITSQLRCAYQEKIGTLPQRVLRQVWEGVQLV